MKISNQRKLSKVQLIIVCLRFWFQLQCQQL